MNYSTQSNIVSDFSPKKIAAEAPKSFFKNCKLCNVVIVVDNLA